MKQFEKIFNTFNEYEKFCCTMSVIRPIDFMALTDWQKKILYEDYLQVSAGIFEKIVTLGASKRDGIRIQWADNIVDLYFQNVNKYIEIMNYLQNNLDVLRDFDKLMHYMYSTAGYCVFMDKELEFFFSLDLHGEIPIFRAFIDENNRVLDFNLYDCVMLDTMSGDISIYDKDINKDVIDNSIKTRIKLAELKQGQCNSKNTLYNETLVLGE